MLQIDGSQGEGGGQVLRTCLSLSALTGRPFRLVNIRANRSKPGLRPQHLTAVLAVAAVCDAEVDGAGLNSTSLEFRPGARPGGGEYEFDVARAANGGSAGAVTLIFQALIWPLMYADARSYLTLHGGTHVPFSPPFHYLAEVLRPAAARLGASFKLELKAWGWYPVGGGTISGFVEPARELIAADFQRADLNVVNGIAAVTNLPAHIPQRMANRAHNLLRDMNLNSQIQAVRDTGRGAGAGLVLWLPNGGFTSLGRKGLPAEKVAENAVAELEMYVDSEAEVDKFLADQLLLPLALSCGRSTFNTIELTQHALTVIGLLRQWLDVTIEVEGDLGRPAQVTVIGTGFCLE